MTVSVVPMLIDAMVSLYTDELPNIRVSDGTGVTDDPGDYLMVGVEDPFNDAESAATTESDWAGVGVSAPRSETGTVTCAALCWSGDTNAKVVRDRVYDAVNAVAALHRDPYDVSLGVPQLLWTSFGTRTRLEQNQGDEGCYALLAFSVYFQAQI